MEITGRIELAPKFTQSVMKTGDELLQQWAMIILTVILVFLYGAALAGRLKPLSDISMVTRLEPLIFVIIGYYFGRLPGQENEKTLKDELLKQAQRAGAAQQAKEQAREENEKLAEKLKNVRITLLPALARTSAEGSLEKSSEQIRSSVNAALKMLSD
jgi:hypothetical protein